jgi:hypothetical protein
MELKTTVVTRTVINSDDFDEFVKSKYGGNFEFVAEQEANNNSHYKFEVPCQYLNSWDIPRIAEIRKGKYPAYFVNLVFQCLYEDGFLPEGKYTVECSW